MTDRLTIEQLAEIVNASDRTYCRLVGDFSVALWSDIGDDERRVDIAWTEAIVKWPHLSEKASHTIWKHFMTKDGWIWGLTRDESRKTDPRLRSWEDLAATETVRFQMATRILQSFVSAGLAPEVL